MSAFMVSRSHIDYLVRAADSRRITGRHNQFQFRNRSGVWVTLRHGHEIEGYEPDIGMSALGQLWWDENRSSIEHRYPDTREDFSNAPGPVGEDFRYQYGERFTRTEITPAQVIRACDCLDYQSCEHPGWKDSDARAALMALKDYAVNALVDEHEAKNGRLQWEIRPLAVVGSSD